MYNSNHMIVKYSQIDYNKINKVVVVLLYWLKPMVCNYGYNYLPWISNTRILNWMFMSEPPKNNGHITSKNYIFLTVRRKNNHWGIELAGVAEVIPPLWFFLCLHIVSLDPSLSWPNFGSHLWNNYVNQSQANND